MQCTKCGGETARRGSTLGGKPRYLCKACGYRSVNVIGFEDDLPDGMKATGVSTLYDKDGNVKAQWVKTSTDKAQQDSAFRAALDGFKEQVTPVPPIKSPSEYSTDLLSIYPVGDHHIGMLAWGKETGGNDYDIDQAERLLAGAMDHLVSVTPASEEAAILVLGDFMHYDSFKPLTPTSGHLLDADSRFPKMVRSAIKCLRYLVEGALKKHAKVRLVIEIGNHDLASAIFLMEMFSNLYEREPRVTVDNSPRAFHCFTFGKNMIGTHHGHSVKMDRLPLLFATDWPKEWGNTVHRTIHCGHVHHDHVKEFTGARVETHGILAPLDAYAANNGYRSGQSMKALVLHREHGEVARHTINAAAL